MIDRRFWPFILLILTLGSLASLGVTLARHAVEVRGWEIATAPDAVLPFRLPLAGVNVELTQYGESELAAHLDRMVDLGIVWVRQTFSWADIEPERADFYWQRWDAVVEAVTARQSLNLVAVLNFSPPWARDPLSPDHPSAPPADNADFARFARLFAERYGSSIDYYQIWDEPNLTDAWGGLEPKAADYLALLQAGYVAIHEADPEATVITAGLAPTTETGPRNYSEVLFLRALYENGGRDYFDAVAGKPYGFDTGPDDRRVDDSVLNFSRLILLREEMVRQGDAQKALWASNFGWNALPEGWEGRPSIWGSVSPEAKLANIQEAYARAEREWPWAGGFIVQHWQPDAPPDDPVWGFALIQHGGQPTDLSPALFANPGPGASAAPPGRYHPTSPFATYAGEWQFSALGADFGQRGDSEATFTFAGTEFALEVRRDNYRAYLYVTIDGDHANALPVDNLGQSYLVLTSDDLEPHTEVIPVARGLSPGIHTLHMRADRGWDQWALGAFRVAVLPSTGGYVGAAWASGALLVVSLSLWVIMARRRSWPAAAAAWLQARRRLGKVTEFVVGALASVLLMVGMLLTWQGGPAALVRRDSPGLLLGLVTAGVLYFSPSFLLTIVAAAVLAFVVYQRLEIGLLLTLFWAPFFLFPVELYQYAVPMTEVCVCLTASAWVLRALVDWARARQGGAAGRQGLVGLVAGCLARWNALDWEMLFLFGLASLALLWSPHQREALREWRTLVFEPLMFYAVLRSVVRELALVRRLVLAFVLSGVAVAVVSLVLYAFGRGVIGVGEGAVRLAGIYGSPNNVGLFLGKVVPFVLSWVVVTTRSSIRLLASLAGAMLLITVILSQSVGALILGIPAGVLAVLLLWNRRQAIIALIVTAAAGILAAIPLSQHTRLGRILDLSYGTSFFRLRLWQSTLQMLNDHPITGVGLDQFLYQYRGRYILPDAWQEPNLSHPHNILLDFWTRLGLGGLSALLWLQVAFWRASWRIYSSVCPVQDTTTLRAVSMGMMGSMAALLAHGLVDNSVFVQDLSYVFALLIALPSLLHTAQVGEQQPARA